MRLDARASLSQLPYCRVAVIVGKYGHIIVERNRLRRRIRELARARVIPHFKGVDLIIRALPGAYAADFSQLGEEIDQIKMFVSSITPDI